MKTAASLDRALARELGRALGELGGRRDDPWIADIARALGELGAPSGVDSGSKRGPRREQSGEDAVLELKPGV